MTLQLTTDGKRRVVRTATAVRRVERRCASRALQAITLVASVLLAAAPAAAQSDSSRDIDTYLGCPGFDEAFQAEMAQILLSRAPQSVDLDWHVRGAPFTDESHVVVEAITLNGRVYRVEHAVATCDELATFVVSFVERDLDAHPPLSLALLVSFFPDIGSTPAVTFGSGFGLQLDVDRFAFIVQASFALPQSGPIALGSETTLSSSSLLGSLLACGRAVPRTRAQELSLDLCGGFSAGTAFGTFSSQPGLEVAGIFELSAAALFRVALVGPFDFLASAGLDVPIVRPAFSAPSPDARSVLASEVVVGRVQIGCAIKI